MKQIILSAKQMTSRERAHSHIQEAMDFPDHYGENLDALWDMLMEIGEETQIFLEDGDLLQENLGEYAEGLLDTFAEACEENPKLLFEVIG